MLQCFFRLNQIIPILVVLLFAVYATNLLGGRRLFLRISEPISSLQIMAEENKETKIPQGQNHHRSAAFPRITSQKTKWPEVVGLTVEEAERIIKEEKPGVQIQVLPPNCGFTNDYRLQRVRLHVDSSGKVHRPPVIG